MWFKRFGVMLFSIGIVLSPASQLRIAGTSIGLGEICALLSVFIGLLFFALNPVVVVKKLSNFQRNYIAFWLLSLVLFCLGSFYAKTINVLDEGSTVHNFSAYLSVFLMISLFLLFYISSFPDLGERVLWNILFFSGLLNLFYTFLWATSLVSFLQYELFYGIRFTGFGLNPNQLALSCLPVPFLALHSFRSKTNSKFKRFYSLLSLLVTCFVGVVTLSDALIFAWLLGFLVYYYNINLRGLFKKSFEQIIIRLAFTFLLILIGLLFIHQINDYIKDTYGDGVSNNQGSDRFLYWSNALHAFIYSPLFGLGPGSYSGGTPFGQEEAHNTFLDWLVSTGLIGGSMFIFLMFQKWRKLWRNSPKEYISIFVALIAFSMFHYILRHFFFWILIIFI